MARKQKETLTEITEGGRVSTILGTGTLFEGTLEFKKPLQINGSFVGEIISDGVLLISETADVKANITAKSVIIGGKVTGNVEATSKLSILTTGKLNGNIRTAKLEIADGVVFDGNCEMITSPNSSSQKK